MTHPKQRLQVLDSARGLAILAVFACHSIGTAFSRVELPWSPGWFRDFSVDHSLLALLPLTLGWTGVAIFFSVSGFCIHLTFMSGRPGDWRGFFIRRFFRIYPPYLLALICFAFILTPTRLSIFNGADLAQFGSHVFLMHNLDHRSYFGINPAFWSIAVEAQLYMLYPALLVLVRRLGWARTLWAIGCLEILMRGLAGIYLLQHGVRIPRWIIGLPFFYWFSWSTGAALADAWLNHRPLPFRKIPPAVWLAVVVLSAYIKPLSEFTFTLVSLWATAAIASQLDSDRPVRIFRFFLTQLAWLGLFEDIVLLVDTTATGAPLQKPVLALLFLTLALWASGGLVAGQESGALAPVSRFLAGQLRFLGICSYSFYLLHMPVVVSVPRILKVLGVVPSGPWATVLTLGACALTYPVVLGLSWLYYRWCEQPSIAAGKALLPNLPATAGATEVT